VPVATVALALLLGALPQAAAPARPAPSRPGLSWADADALARALDDVEKSFKTGAPLKPRSIVVTEGQLNSYLNLTLGPKVPVGVSDLVVQLAGEGVRLLAKVDLDRVPLKRPTDGSWSLVSFLTGVVPVELKGRLETRDGVGTIDLQEARLAGWAVPLPLVAQLVSTSTRTASQPQGFDLGAPFRLPYAIKRVRFEVGRAVVDF
jgi:hypothetical protein